MSTLTRAVGKTMLKSLANYETISSLVTRSSNPDKPLSPKSLPKWRDLLDEKFMTLSCDWRSYKEETGLSEDEFNKVENDVPAIKHNDDWYTRLETDYMELCEKVDELLNKPDPVLTTPSVESKEIAEQKVNKKVGELLVLQIEAETESITDEVKILEDEIAAVVKGAIEGKRAESLKSKTNDLSMRINVGLQSLLVQCIPVLEETEAKIKTSLHTQFVSEHRKKLAEICCKIVEKTEAKGGGDALRPAVEKNKDHTFLKKIDPPKFDGDIVVYPDFKRKWVANVSRSNLCTESELDRLRDNVPSQAAKMLFSEVTMERAWAIMDKLFGNKTMIANKLKTQLKEIKAVGNEDYEVVINLAIDVKTIENRLRELQL